MDYNNRRYLIIPSSIVNQIDFSQVMETSVDTLRYSIDETKTFVKYYVTVVEEDTTETYLNTDTGQEENVVIKKGVYGRPSIYSEQYTEYTHQEILVVLETEEWNSPIEN
jgi:hypothetical protein